ncbi:hypothetical protein FJZ23_00900 [Candidatus Parcubacteria bacterium]|nr:hypothetical protein [Candidatus Parcubacteria bacterium]
MPESQLNALKRVWSEPVRDAEGRRGTELIYRIYTALDDHADIEEFSIHPDERDQDAEQSRTFFRSKKTGKRPDAGEALEAMLNVEADRSMWFGAYTFRTTQYDDMKGVDAVLEWDEGDRFGFAPRLAVDFSGSTNATRIADKMGKVENGVRVKYFRSQATDEMDQEMTLDRLPIAVLGVDAAFAEGMGQYALLFKQTVGGEERLPPKTFAEFPIRFLLLEEAVAQVDDQVQAESRRLFDYLTRMDGLPASVQEALACYRSLTLQPVRPSVVSVATCFAPATEDFARLEEQMKNRTPARSYRRGDEKLPPSPVEVLGRWRNLAAVRELLTEKKQELENAARAAQVQRWREASKTYEQLMAS